MHECIYYHPVSIKIAESPIRLRHFEEHFQAAGTTFPMIVTKNKTKKSFSDSPNECDHLFSHEQKRSSRGSRNESPISRLILNKRESSVRFPRPLSTDRELINAKPRSSIRKQRIKIFIRHRSIPLHACPVA